jgi:magnesium transporter
VALRFQKYALISAAVVDQSGPAGGHDHRRRRGPHHPGGASEDVLLLSGAGEGDINSRCDSYRPGALADRNLHGSVASAIIACSRRIEQMVALAVLMPIGPRSAAMPAPRRWRWRCGRWR